MKIYRCFLGCLLVFFIVIGVLFVVSHINEQRLDDKGTLIWEKEIEDVNEKRGVGGDVTGYCLCEGFWELHCV